MERGFGLTLCGLSDWEISVVRSMARTEHHIGGVKGQVVELAEGSEVVDWFLARDLGRDGADPADGSGDHAGLRRAKC